MTDVTLAAGVPSITARSAGMVLPIARSIAELFDSRPGPTGKRLGTFLIAAMYQGSAVACAMFLTGQASNLLGADLALKLANVEVTWASWFVAAIVPGLLSCAGRAVDRLSHSDAGSDAHAGGADFARRRAEKMGPLSRDEWITLLVFAGVGLMWITSAWHGLDVTFVALLGIGVLLASGTLTWQSGVERALGVGRVRLVRRHAADGRAAQRHRLDAACSPRTSPACSSASRGPVVLVAILIIYFYAHYFFASITAHMLAMFPPFVALLIGIGVPPLLAVYSLLCLANLTAGLTHYGTTTGPILFGAGYVTRSDWWRVGFYVSVANLLIWLTIGFAWWKWLGFW